jgi:asparagine synthase (glutamine-hydrolysing)
MLASTVCGISAIYRRDRARPEAEDIRRMCSAIAHRGPDGAGFARMGGGSALLGHVRLSIIDVAGGAQPIFNEDRSVAIVANGEVYDYDAHRERLVEAGHTFRTHSDTEVIVHLYEEHGLSFLEKLNGEFAFVLFDNRTQRLIAARDRMGVKPLFYSVLGRELLIGSEAKGILALDRVPRALSPDYLLGTLLGAFPYGVSAFEGIRSLTPGHYVVATEHDVGPEVPYWVPAFETHEAMPFEDAKARVRSLFVAAVKRRMVADVPVGTYLSGGLDSSLVCATMAALGAGVGQPFKAFNVGFGDPRYDESDLARKTAEHFGASFETVPCGVEAMAEGYEQALYHIEMALVNPGAIAKQMLSRMVHGQDYKVCITGEGADEVFGGYPYFKQEAIWRMLLDPERRDEGERLWTRFTDEERHTEGALWHRGRSWKTETHWFDYPSFHQMRLRESSRRTPRILSKSVIAAASAATPDQLFLRNHDPAGMRALHPFNATKLVAFSQLANYIIPTLGDRVEMANSVECRTPFLDRDLVDFVGSVPPAYLLNAPALREKYLLREAFAGTLPDFVSNERKKPFMGDSWQTFVRTKRGAQIFGDYCSWNAVKRAGAFNPTAVPMLRALWKVAPEGSATWKKLDILAGLIMGAQCLHARFVEGRVESRADFAMEDRTPPAPSEFSPPGRATPAESG